ncbi:hypothetical protein [uncultured Herbaspirillum sp.]|uniref:hypothetical protein n=1 Tax=uncultured Herbaspirillum sp. TaxID=160236 RepID=UPI0026153496|nr:hypothetical protein [uncultured Herbaspirillum sp.]
MKRINTANRASDLFGDGKDGFKAAQPGVSMATYMSALFMNHVQEAIVRTIEATGVALSDTDYDQFPTAIIKLINDRTTAVQTDMQTRITALIGGAPAALDTLKELADALNDDANFAATITARLNAIPAAYNLASLPSSNVGPIFVIEACEMWTWVNTAYYTGYRSPLCGRAIHGHTLAPLAIEVDAVGGTLSKTAYARLWAYARENNLVVASGSWTAGTHYFVDVDANTFRCPDLRDMFMRFTGTDADTANARALGSYKADTIKAHTHGGGVAGLVGGQYQSGGAPTGVGPTSSTGTAETAPKHTAYAPRLHA